MLVVVLLHRGLLCISRFGLTIGKSISSASMVWICHQGKKIRYFCPSSRNFQQKKKFLKSHFFSCHTPLSNAQWNILAWNFEESFWNWDMMIAFLLARIGRWKLVTQKSVITIYSWDTCRSRRENLTAHWATTSLT